MSLFHMTSQSSLLFTSIFSSNGFCNVELSFFRFFNVSFFFILHYQSTVPAIPASGSINEYLFVSFVKLLSTTKFCNIVGFNDLDLKEFLQCGFQKHWKRAAKLGSICCEKVTWPRIRGEPTDVYTLGSVCWTSRLRNLGLKKSAKTLRASIIMVLYCEEKEGIYHTFRGALADKELKTGFFNDVSYILKALKTKIVKSS